MKNLSINPVTNLKKQEISSPAIWRFSEKLLFRFFFCYFLLYILPFPFSRIPFLFPLTQSLQHLYEWLVPLVGQQVFDITRELPLPGGSGDTTFNYLQVFIQLSLAMLISIIWGVFDRKRKSYVQLFNLLLVFLRYYLGLMMLTYGMSKIFVNQFSGLSLFDLIKPYGDSSPMGLMWNFMEYSSSYSIFSGLAEFVGGMLLFFRRTTKLGALIIFAVMLNVFLLNMSFDIPVKIFSFHLMVMALFILVSYFSDLLDFFVRNRPTLPRSHSSYFHSRRWNIASYVVKGIFIVHALIVVTSNNFSTREEWGGGAALPPLYGIYEVQDYIVNDDTLAPLATDPIRWDKLVIDKHNGGIVTMDAQVNYLVVAVDTTETHLKLSPYNSEEKYEFNYLFENGQLSLDGSYEEDAINVILKRKDEKEFLLMQREFQWINEYPYNR